MAEITAVVQDESRAFSQVQSRPLAKIDRLRYVLLLWPELIDVQQVNPIPASAAKKAENK